MNSTMAQKYEFNRYNNEFHSSYDTRKNHYTSHRDTRMFQTRSSNTSNIICFRCKGNHHIKDCKVCAYCKDLDNPHHVDYCPKANYCHHCKDIVGHNIKRCPYLNKPKVISQTKEKKTKEKFSFNLLQEDIPDLLPNDDFVLLQQECPTLPKSSSKQSFTSQFSVESKKFNERLRIKFINIINIYKLNNYIKTLKCFCKQIEKHYDDSIYTDSSITDYDEPIDWDNVSSIKIDFNDQESTNDSWW